jgi:predicted TIM-barrel fold metal-dependent hydrolase
MRASDSRTTARYTEDISEFRKPVSMKNMRIVDCDVHVHELPDEIAEHCEMPWRKAVEAIVPESAASAHFGSVGDYVVPGLAQGAGDGSDPLWPGGQNRPMFVTSPTQCRRDLDSLGIDSAILFPDHLLKLALQVNADYAMALARAYNRWLIDKWLSNTKGFYGALCMAPQDPEGSAEEIRKLGKKHKMVCAYLPAAGINPLYGNKKYHPIYEAAQEIGLPVAVHGLAICYPTFPCQMEQFDEVGRHGFGHSLQMAVNFFHMMCNGIPVRFPELKISFNEGGLAWVPWVMMRLNNEYHEWRGRLLPFFKERPSHYLKNFRFSTQPAEEPEKPEDYLKLLELIGSFDNIIYASDWPHHDFDHPSRILNYPMPEKVKRQVMGENAAQFFDIPRS